MDIDNFIPPMMVDMSFHKLGDLTFSMVSSSIVFRTLSEQELAELMPVITTHLFEIYMKRYN